jgi:cellulose synthase/poly-beta-1,6-N-acetylglucosamine synthase-like glycosyltransferase
MENILNLTIVIPTVGENSLLEVIKNLNSNISIPKKILVVIYKKNLIKIDKKIKNYDNVEIATTNSPGQVHQRVEGFKLAKTDFVMQLDADCFVDNQSIIEMINFLKSHDKASVGPCFLDIKNNLPIHKLIDEFKIKRTLKNLVLGFPNDNQIMGKISKSGTNFGVDFNFLKEDIIQVEWIPGGCSMHYKKYLCLKNYFPFKGKAFYEDLIHSKILIQNNIKLFIIKKAICKTDFPIFPKKLKEFIMYLKSYNYSCKIYNVSIVRKYTCLSLYIMRYIKNQFY